MKKDLGAKGELFPQSVFIVASYSEEGVPNAMNVAWGGECTRGEVCINIGDHKTTENILARKAFTVSPADAAHVVEADYFGIATGRKVNKAEASKLTFVKSEYVDAPVIEEFPLTMECEVTRIDGDVHGARIIFDSELNRESINSYRTWFETKHFDHAWAKLPMDEFLVVIGAARKLDDGTIHPTRAGLLMFGKEYRIEYEYPSYFLDYREHTDPTVRWTDRIQSQSPDWSGNVFDFYTIVSRKIVQLLKVPFKLVDTVRMENTPVHDAVREALVNCLVNADFFLPRGVVVEGYPDKIIFRNPGTIIVGKKQMLRGGDSEPRNANIMKMFNLIGLGARAGSGVPDIFSIWDSAGYMMNRSLKSFLEMMHQAKQLSLYL